MSGKKNYYKDYKWIKVKKPSCIQFIGRQRYIPEEHHIEETEFLIAEVRKLAEQIDSLSESLERYRKEKEAIRQYENKQMKQNADHVVGYYDDDYREE